MRTKQHTNRHAVVHSLLSVLEEVLNVLRDGTILLGEGGKVLLDLDVVSLEVFAQVLLEGGVLGIVSGEEGNVGVAEEAEEGLLAADLHLLLEGLGGVGTSIGTSIVTTLLLLLLCHLQEAGIVILVVGLLAAQQLNEPRQGREEGGPRVGRTSGDQCRLGDGVGVSQRLEGQGDLILELLLPIVEGRVDPTEEEGADLVEVPPGGAGQRLVRDGMLVAAADEVGQQAADARRDVGLVGEGAGIAGLGRGQSAGGEGLAPAASPADAHAAAAADAFASPAAGGGGCHRLAAVGRRVAAAGTAGASSARHAGNHRHSLLGTGGLFPPTGGTTGTTGARWRHIIESTAAEGCAAVRGHRTEGGSTGWRSGGHDDEKFGTELFLQSR